MATKAQTPAPTKGAVAPAKPQGGALATTRQSAGELATTVGADILADSAAGSGWEGVDQEAIAIPFLAILQKNSPQCDPQDPAYIADAKPGMLMNTVTNELYDGGEGVLIVPCAFQRKFLRWKPREQGGGFKGEIQVDEIAKLRANGTLVEFENRMYMPGADQNVDPKRHDKVADTRVHYILLLDKKSGTARQMVLSLASTQIRRSKQMMSLLSDAKVFDEQGRGHTPPTFANVVKLVTVGEKNEKGSWSGVQPALAGFVKDGNTYAMAKAFNQMVNAGRANVNFDQANKTEGEGGDPGGAPDDGKGF